MPTTLFYKVFSQVSLRESIAFFRNFTLISQQGGLQPPSPAASYAYEGIRSAKLNTDETILMPGTDYFNFVKPQGITVINSMRSRLSHKLLTVTHFSK